MNKDELCITWKMTGVPKCVLPAQHVIGTDEVEHDPNCHGCKPARREIGALCRACWLKLEQVATDWDVWFAQLGGEVSAFTPESVGHSVPGPRLPYSKMQLDVTCVQQADSRCGHPLDVWVATEAGAMDSVHFRRAAARTIQDHPRLEASHQLQRTRCAVCKARSMIYFPPAVFGSDAIVKCGLCGYTIDGERFELLAAIEAQCCRKCATKQGCSDGSCKCHAVAPAPAWKGASDADSFVLDLTKPSHRRIYVELKTEA